MTCLLITSASQKMTLSLAHTPRHEDAPLSKTAQQVIDVLHPKVPVTGPVQIV
ncbi:MAG: hypothetical protein AAFQ64_03245 [Pseudomonadota bacterium]